MAAESSHPKTDQEPANSPDLVMQALIGADLQCTSDLDDLLQQERTALRDRNVEQLTQLLDRKSELLSNLQQNSQQRSEVLKRTGFSVDAEGMGAFFTAQQPETANRCREQWSQLEKQLERCNFLNEVNAKIAHRSQLTTNHILGILTGASQSLELYSAHGTSSDSKEKQSIAKA
mgnify:CR=1 FL=1|jgi:flagella synthesis protein FlgN|tara:strand:+ start:5673 stop:6197 length:525 start_codon:yes stop_codon:yes gene_type:complete